MNLKFFTGINKHKNSLIRKIGKDAYLHFDYGKTPYIVSNKTDTYTLSNALINAGFKQYHDSKTTCYRMSNITETDTEYIVPVVLARAMVQDYSFLDINTLQYKTVKMAKLPEDLKTFQVIDYETFNPIDRLPTFELHPAVESRDAENGYVENIHYDEDHERIVGILHAIKNKLSDTLQKYFKERMQLGVSIGFQYLEGGSGFFQNSIYDIAQTHLLLTHLAIFTNEQANGRCPLKHCAVGKSLDIKEEKEEEICIRCNGRIYGSYVSKIFTNVCKQCEHFYENTPNFVNKGYNKNASNTPIRRSDNLDLVGKSLDINSLDSFFQNGKPTRSLANYFDRTEYLKSLYNSGGVRAVFEQLNEDIGYNAFIIENGQYFFKSRFDNDKIQLIIGGFSTLKHAVSNVYPAGFLSPRNA